MNEHVNLEPVIKAAENMELWNAVEKTDPAHVKAITGKAYKGTSPRPHWLVQQATKTFGPIGIGWGFVVLNERIEEGAPGEKLHMARVRVWYVWKGVTGEVEHIGATMFSGLRRDGKPFTDEDAPKKSITDALVKALSLIGFAGDIFMGRFDDSKYVDSLEQAFAPPPAPEPAISIEQYDALMEELNHATEADQAGFYKHLGIHGTGLSALRAAGYEHALALAKKLRARAPKMKAQ